MLPVPARWFCLFLALPFLAQATPSEPLSDSALWAAIEKHQIQETVGHIAAGLSLATTLAGAIQRDPILFAVGSLGMNLSIPIIGYGSDHTSQIILDRLGGSPLRDGPWLGWGLGMAAWVAGPVFFFTAYSLDSGHKQKMNEGGGGAIVLPMVVAATLAGPIVSSWIIQPLVWHSFHKRSAKQLDRWHGYEQQKLRAKLGLIWSPQKGGLNRSSQAVGLQLSWTY
jgi:hypothetical protein